MWKLSTRNKIRIARLIGSPFEVWRRTSRKRSIVRVKRSQVRYELDLSEGIDLAIFLFGLFETEVQSYYARILKPGSVALDIGANIGAHTLRMARIVGRAGKVIAFEPTDYAYGKLVRNLALNPDLEPVVESYQSYLSNTDEATIPSAITAAWPLYGSNGHALDVSDGLPHETTGAKATTLDTFLTEHPDGHPSLIKLDVDGCEMDVLEGSLGLLNQHQPPMIIELAPYVFQNGEEDVVEILNFLTASGYQSVTHYKREIRIQDSKEILRQIPHNGAINVLVR